MDLNMSFNMWVRTYWDPPLPSYSHEEKMTLEVVFSVHKLHHYILMLVTNSNHVSFILSQWVINGKCSHWSIILQELDLEYFTSKSKKSLSI
jgi:hypothetical protein